MPRPPPPLAQLRRRCSRRTVEEMIGRRGIGRVGAVVLE